MTAAATAMAVTARGMANLDMGGASGWASVQFRTT